MSSSDPQKQTQAVEDDDEADDWYDNLSRYANSEVSQWQYRDQRIFSTGCAGKLADQSAEYFYADLEQSRIQN